MATFVAMAKPHRTQAARVVLDEDPVRSLRNLRAFETGTLQDLKRQEIARARDAGLSWQAIGDVMGITGEAVRKRYGDQPPPPDAGAEPSEFELNSGANSWATAGHLDAHGTPIEDYTSTEFPAGGGTQASLHEILIKDVDKRFYLSPTACAGILRRADRAGDQLPPDLRSLLERIVAGEVRNGLADLPE